MIIYSNWFCRNTNLIALCRMNWLRGKLETGILETTVVVKWSDFSGKNPGCGKERILRGNV